MQSDTEQNNTNNNIFTLCIDRIMEETMKNKRAGISWTMLEMLEDLDFADDIYIYSCFITQTRKHQARKSQPVFKHNRKDSSENQQHQNQGKDAKSEETIN